MSVEEVLELYSYGLHVLLIAFCSDRIELLCIIGIYFSSMEMQPTPVDRCRYAWYVAEIAYIYIFRTYHSVQSRHFCSSLSTLQ